jgi:hypothetical protein
MSSAGRASFTVSIPPNSPLRRTSHEQTTAVNCLVCEYEIE